MSHTARSFRGLRSYQQGLTAEVRVVERLQAEGYTVLAQRLKTPFGEIDALVCTDQCLVAVEVKRRPSLREGAEAISPKQQQRLLAAVDFVCNMHPEWQRADLRFDCVLVDSSGAMKRIKDAFRQE